LRILKNRSSESKSQVTCVRLSKDTRNRLAGEGSKDQTFDDIINVLIDNNRQETSSEVKTPKVIVGENGAELVQ